MESLSLLLWRERELLETLLYKLELEQLVLGEGRVRWLARATRETQAVLDAIKETEILRAAVADGAASDVGLGHGATLRAITARAIAPWNTILAEHHEALCKLREEIKGASETNQHLLSAGHKDLKAGLHSRVANSHDTEREMSALVDEAPDATAAYINLTLENAAFQSAITATSGLLSMTLAEFLE